MDRLYLSGLHKSSGKTAAAIGVAAALAEAGTPVQPFKKGPDYIDPGWLSAAAGRPCRNLDFHTMGGEEIRAAVAPQGRELALIEGTKGLHDGVDPEGADSNAALAALLEAPVVLVVDARGMTRGIAPTVLGHARFDPQIRVAGVLLNRVGGRRHEAKLRAALARYTDLPVLGALPDTPALGIEMPYLGLIPAAEQPEAEAAIGALRRAVREHVDLEALRRLAEAPATSATPPPAEDQPAAPATTGGAGRGAERVRIGVAYDPAFNFYYPGDLEALEAAGAQLCWIDTLRDAQLPPLDGLFIGGGFPERHAGALAANRPLRAAVQEAAAGGLPVYAECGGLLYLARRLHVGGEAYPMAGVFPVDAEMGGRPQGHGYVRLQPTGSAPWSPAAEGTGPIPAHEFHYSRLRGRPAELPCAYRIDGGAGVGDGRDGLLTANTLASYAHLRHTAATPWAARFVEFVRRRRSAPGGDRTAGRRPERAL